MADKKLSKRAQNDKNQKLIVTVRKRYQIMTDADSDNRELAMEDLKFVNIPGEQWDTNMTQQRGERPCYEFNKLRVNGKRVINEIRANRPQAKVRAVEGGDKEIAEIYEGLGRNIWNISDADSVVDAAAEYQVDAGMGAWRLDTEYSSDSAFDQDILIKVVSNPFCLYADPSSKDPMKRDAEDWVLTERLSKKSFEEKYPDAEPTDFDDVEFDDDDDWEDEDWVRIAEYWFKEHQEKELWVVSVPDPDGDPNAEKPGFKQIVVDSTTDEGIALAKQPGFKPDRTRQITYHKIMSCVVSGSAILEEPTEWAGSMFPFVVVYGEYKIIDGEVIWWGLHRFSKDAQQSYNVSRTATDESIASHTRAKFWASAVQAAGLTDQWTRAHKENLPFQIYNPDPQAPGAPVDMPSPDVPVALIQQSQLAAQDIRDTAGLHEASFGEESNEKSGIALQRKQAQASLVTYNYPDNISKGVQRTWELMIDIIPNVYDAERELRILGSDGSEDYKKVNQMVYDPQTEKMIRINDLSVGKYDVTVTSGPSFSTQREEAAETYGQIVQGSPEIMGIAGDLIFKSMDLPYSEDIAERLRSMLPPQIQQMLNEDTETSPEVQAAMQQAQQAMKQVEERSQLVEAAAQEVQQEKMVAETEKLRVKEAVSELEVKRAQFDGDVATKLAAITKQMAALTLRQAEEVNTGISEASAAMSDDMGKALVEIQNMVSDFMQQSVQTLAQIQSKNQPTVIVPRSPKVVRLVAKREKGALVAIPEYEQETDIPPVPL